MAKSLETWKNQVFGKTIDLDNQSFDCVDVSKHWIVYLTDKPWQTSAGWGNAKDIYSFWPETYLEKVPRGNAPKLGDIVVMNGTVGAGYGHTGAVVAIDGNNITIYQQNTFTQQPVYTGVYNAYVSYITGFLRPKVAFNIGAEVQLQPYQRVASYEAKYRDAPNSNGTLLQTFTGGETYDFKGFVKGESVDGNDIWFVGRYTGGYVWSGAFKDTGTHDLPDLTPATTQLQSFQRQVGNSVINYRKKPEIKPDNVIQTFQPGEILDFDAWTRATSVDGNDVWFRGRYTGGWSHSGGFTNQTTNGLVEVKLEVVPVVTTPTYPKPTSDQEVTKVYNKKHALSNGYAPTDLVDVGGGQKLRKEAADSMALMQQAQTLTLASGYRSFATQQTVYQQNVDLYGQEEADRQSARPGYSEHQTGLTMDFGPIDDAFQNTAAYTWLTQNAHKYGWLLRYPSDKEAVTGYMSEPWHWRYVGVTVATDMRDKGVTTLEEYYGIEGGDYPKDAPNPIPADPKPVEEPDDPTQNPLFKVFQAIVKFLNDIIAKLTTKK